jgi:predicted dehydrogenase
MPIDVAFIGAGGIASLHLDDLAEIDRADVVAICDIDEETAIEAAEPHDAAVFTDQKPLFAEAEFDALFVCLPPFAHGRPERLAVEHGVDLFVQKPLGLDRETVAELDTLIGDSDILAQVGYEWRYGPGIERAREILDGRDIGYVEGYWWGGVPGSEGHWWRERDKSGGQVVEQGTHIFDTLRYLAGDIERVSAAGSHRIEDAVDFPDATSTTMEHENDAVSHISTSCAAEDGKIGLEVVAEDATFRVGANHVEGVVDDEEIDEEFEPSPYRREVEAFLDAVETRDDSSLRSTYADGRRSFELTLAMMDSINTGEPVVVE